MIARVVGSIRLKYIASLTAVSAEVVEVEYDDRSSDAEYGEDTLKLTARGLPRPETAHYPKEQHTPRPGSRDETKKEIQEDDEATLRELLIR